MKKLICLVLLALAVSAAHPQWTLLSLDFVPYSSVTAYDSVIIAGSSSFGSYDMAVSYNHGDTWTGMNLNPSSGVHYLYAHDTFVYACTPNGIYKSVKEALNWIPFSEGLPAGPILKMCIQDNIMLATGAGSVYKRIVGENAWTTISESSPVDAITDFAFNGNLIVLAGLNGIAESTDLGSNWSLWPSSYIHVWNAITIKGDTIIAASKGRVNRKLISSGNISEVSNGLTKLWHPYGDDYYGEFEMFHQVGNDIFLCGETGIFKLSDDSWFWNPTDFQHYTYALANNGDKLFAVRGYGGLWERPLNELTSIANHYPGFTGPINIYPNPAFSHIVIETQTTPGVKTILTVFNLNGQQVLEHLVIEPKTVVDIDKLPKGLYFLKNTNNMTVQTGKFVKN
jgi:hypothetical protein